MKKAEKLLNFSENQLRQVEEQLKKNEGHASIVKYAIEVLKSPYASKLLACTSLL